jgi:UPF0755 protein
MVIFRTRKKRGLGLLLVICIFIVASFLFSAPVNNTDVTIHVYKGMTVKQIATILKEKNSIKSIKVFQGFVSFLSKKSKIEIGDYYIKNGTPSWRIAWMLSRGIHNVDPIKVTIPEGYTNNQMATLFEKQIPEFDRIEFDEKTKDLQGYLFPDTYFFYPLTTTDEIIERLSSNFTQRISSLEDEIDNSGHTKSEIIRMAAILEKEARGENDSEIVSGILWKRLSIGMPLQVDAAPQTYTLKVLPQKPIANPGLVAIKATLNPQSSPYLYYLHDKTGMIHFAKDFAEHKRNIATYLK